jgi:hypothetical protein
MKIKDSKLTLIASLMMLGLSFGFTACHKNDDPMKKPMLTDVYGEYSGKMAIAMPKTYDMYDTDEYIDIDIAATVNNDTISFAKFPVGDIIKVILPEAEAAVIAATLGDVKYATGYTAVFNAAEDSVVMELAPKPLELKFSMGEGEAAKEMSIKIDISAVDKGYYAISKKNLKFTIKATGVTVGEAPFEGFSEMQFSFDMNKK